MSSSEDISAKTKSVIELKKLQLFGLQRRLRRYLASIFNFKPIHDDVYLLSFYPFSVLYFDIYLFYTVSF